MASAGIIHTAQQPSTLTTLVSACASYPACSQLCIHALAYSRIAECYALAETVQYNRKCVNASAPNLLVVSVVSSNITVGCWRSTRQNSARHILPVNLRNLLVTAPSFIIFVLLIYEQDTIDDNKRFEDKACADHTSQNKKAPSGEASLHTSTCFYWNMTQINRTKSSPSHLSEPAKQIGKQLFTCKKSCVMCSMSFKKVYINML